MLTATNHEVLEFASDATAAGRRIRVLGVIDCFMRQSPVEETVTSFLAGAARACSDERSPSRASRSRFAPPTARNDFAHYLEPLSARSISAAQLACLQNAGSARPGMAGCCSFKSEE